MKEYNQINFSATVACDSDAQTIVANLKDVILASATANYGKRSMTKNFAMDGATYTERELDVRKAALAYAASKSGVSKIEDKRDIVMAFDNPTFVSIFNSIVSEALTGVIVNSASSQLLSLCNIDDVDLGDSKTYEIETKGLPIAQRASYLNNVSFLDGYTTTSITVTPKLYTIGSTVDYTRILANGYDWGKELARVAMGILYAQYKLVAGVLFNTANVTGTPLYKASFTADGYVGMISDLQALNKAGVKAYGTLPAFQKQGTTATTNYGFATQDKMVEDGFLGRAFGVDNIMLDQATDLSAPFIDANRESLLLIPNNRILLMSEVGDKPAKLVRESFVRVIAKEATDGSLYRNTYTYTMAFDCGLATCAHYAVQSV